MIIRVSPSIAALRIQDCPRLLTNPPQPATPSTPSQAPRKPVHVKVRHAQ